MSIDARWVTRVCPICGSNDEKKVVAESNIDLAKLDSFAFASRKTPEYMHPRLIECPKCHLWYGNPVLAPETLGSLYLNADFDSGAEARFASEVYARQITRIASRLPDRHGALDIGTGDGVFMEQLRSLGFKGVEGVEPSVAPYNAAKPEIRKNIRLGLFDSKDYTPGCYSLVTCFQTIEHVPEPLALVQGAYQSLKPGGALVIAGHNRASLSARILGFGSPIFDVEHLQLFHPESAQALLRTAGFGSVEAYPLWNRYPLAYWLKLFPFPPALKANVMNWAGNSALGRMPIALPAGNLVCVGWKQPADLA